MSTFEIGPNDFLLDGRPLQILSGALHYFRVHPDQWEDRIHKARLMGLNTIETYVAWNFHATERGQFDTSGRRDLGRFLDLVAAEGMHAIVRPGPYICAEWDNGGLPAWLFAEPNVGIRRNEPAFLAAVAEYFAALMPIVTPRQATRGGAVLMLQVENEYGAYGDDPEYLRALVRLTREGGIEVPLFTCDQANDEMLRRGGLPEVHRTATFGSRSMERLATLRKHQPTGPLMCMEFWNGWFDSWGHPHHTAAAATNAKDLDDLLTAGASVNLYMFHGGTNFGLTNGANDKGTYLPITTSYDYDAPLSERGAPTAKYHVMREVISRHAAVAGEPPRSPLPGPALKVNLDRGMPMSEVAAHFGHWKGWSHLPTADEVGQWSGLTLYRTHIEADDHLVSFAEVRDRATLHLDNDPVGVLSRTEKATVQALPAREGILTVLVEDQGRVNYGRRLGEAKGLMGPARTATRTLSDWETLPLTMDSLGGAIMSELRRRPVETAPDVPLAGPVLRFGTFSTMPGIDHFLSSYGWGKGLAWVNGFLLGRYWSVGPTRTLYVPGPLLRADDNELVVLEIQGAASSLMRFVSWPHLGITEY